MEDWFVWMFITNWIPSFHCLFLSSMVTLSIWKRSKSRFGQSETPRRITRIRDGWWVQPDRHMHRSLLLYKRFLEEVVTVWKSGDVPPSFNNLNGLRLLVVKQGRLKGCIHYNPVQRHSAGIVLQLTPSNFVPEIILWSEKDFIINCGVWGNMQSASKIDYLWKTFASYLTCVRDKFAKTYVGYLKEKG